MGQLLLGTRLHSSRTPLLTLTSGDLTGKKIKRRSPSFPKMDLRSSLILAVVLTVISTGEALKCHQCTSYESAKCGDPFYYDDGQIKTNEFLGECPSDGKEYTLCRKIYQNVRGDERVVRSCGWEEYENSAGEKKDCYSTVLEEYNTYVCTCADDGCNGSTTIKVSMISVLMAIALAAVFK